jgi:cytochrome b involved in lipid metabolism
MTTHPGGEDLILNEIGKNIDVPFEEAEHTKSARNIFKDLPLVGVIQSI